jgi:hypothetical protein
VLAQRNAPSKLVAVSYAYAPYRKSYLSEILNLRQAASSLSGKTKILYWRVRNFSKPMESLLLQILAIIIGGSISSFLNVVVYRISAGLSIL